MEEEKLKLIQWLGLYCVSHQMLKKKLFNSYWALLSDVDKLYDGIEDDRLNWYSNEEILEIYNKTFNK